MATMNNRGNQVPGFGFLQDLMKSAGSSIPGMGTWIAPTLDPDELSKRIEELRTVQFWLEQNAKLIATSIQALEVQRMTLSTLKNLNVQVSDIGEALKIKVPAPAAPPADAPSGMPPKRQRRSKAATDPGAAAQPTSAVVDPMQWWGALTQQFSELAAQAVKDTGADALAKAAAELPAQAMQAAKAAATKQAAATARPARRRKS